MRRAWLLLGAVAPAMLRDSVGLAGAALIVRGAWMLHPAAGYLTGGALLVGAGVLLARRGV